MTQMVSGRLPGVYVEYDQHFRVLPRPLKQHSWSNLVYGRNRHPPARQQGDLFCG